ncbi:5-formyltetrahydrofolate cyclo-ligase [Fistulifera solaris]|uniref:5-formyltetrahydrofolate cyclo-ligase n=1 Tax=Fistulifera solaris TaxID=1519565 RepID=A0A1Z5KBY4_FISSO|nr:5-formyltetrahydrofolate cyclo-ligase [Fistulifera solaris]|eukprot:GAX23652.1 5-formyltetrahydrofolate cyclo-ligase [Fistulifera solaris]
MYAWRGSLVLSALLKPGVCYHSKASFHSALRPKMSGVSATHGANDIVTRKKQLRKQVRSMISELSKNDIESQSLEVWERLFDLPVYKQAQSVGLFLSMPSGEIDTDLAIRNAVEAGKHIYVPQVGKNFEHADMELLKVDQSASKAGELFHQAWPRNKWGIPEPPPGMPIVLAKEGDIDVLIVPGLAFDRKCDRLGQGKGYYDRFIQRMISSDKKPPCLIAVCLTCQLVEEIPVESYDRRMDLIITPSEIIGSKNK